MFPFSSVVLYVPTLATPILYLLHNNNSNPVPIRFLVSMKTNATAKVNCSNSAILKTRKIIFASDIHMDFVLVDKEKRSKILYSFNLKKMRNACLVM